MQNRIEFGSIQYGVAHVPEEHMDAHIWDDMQIRYYEALETI